MKKINITFILLLALALVFTGCREEMGEDTTAPPAVTESPTDTTCAETTAEETTSAPETTECTHPDLITREIVPNCTENYNMESYCNLCGYTRYDPLPPYGHRFVNNTCTICGISGEPEASEDLEFRKFDNYAVLVGIGTCKDNNVVIPATVDGLPVTEIWDRAFYKAQHMTSVKIPEGVTYIESEAFLNCPYLSEVFLPASLENVSGSLSLGFIGCPALTTIKLADGNEKYYVSSNCLIEKATGKLVLAGGKCEIPADGSVKSIGAHAFAGNLLLKSVAIPEGVTDIHTSAFEGCTNLVSVTLPTTLKTIRQSAFKGCTALTSISIPDSLTEIYNGAFSDCKALKNVTLSKKLTMIDSEAFKGCAIEKIEIPAGVKELGAAFAECEKLKNVILPAGFERFSGHTFAGCTSLESINLPASLEYLGFFTFKNCTALKELNFGGTVSEWNSVYKQESWNDDAAFTAVKCSDGTVKLFSDSADGGSAGLEYKIDGNGAVLVGIGNCTDKNIVIAPTFGGVPITRIDSFAFSECDYIESIVIPEGVTVISNEAFYLCKNLKKVTLPSTVDIIASWAFAGCESLEKVAIPDGIMIIEQRAFSDCVKLSSLTLGKELESIEENAFMNCTSLKSVTIPAKVIYFGNSAFAGCSSLESVTLKKGVDMIGESVFKDCPRLTSIKYTGKIADWEKIGTYPDWMGGSSIERVACSDGDARLWDTFDGTPGLTYGIAKDGKSAFLAGIGVFTDSEIVVATEFNGLPVTSIAYRVINNAPNLTSIYISKTVTDLPDELFYKCDKILSLTVDPENPVYMSEGNCIIERKSGKLLYGCNGSVIPAGVKIIGESAFASCKELSSLTLPEGVEVIEPRAFSDCTDLSSITLPESLVSVGEFAFYNCSSLESITFGSKIKTIDRYAFSTCTGLTSISLPDTVVLGDSIFYNCTSLKSVKLPAAQTSLCGTFFGCSSLESVVLPDTLTELLGSSFQGCTSLKSIALPASVHNINGGDFAGCSSLTDFSYGGTVAEWNAIYKQYWKEGAAFTTVRCSDGEADILEITEAEALEKAAEYWRIMYGIKDGDHTPDSPAGTKYKMVVTELPSENSPCYEAQLQAVGISTKLLDELNIDAKTGDVVLHADASERFYDILRGFEAKFFNVNGGYLAGNEVTLDEYCDAVWGKRQIFYTELDLDGDGVTELVIYDSALKQATLVLHEENGVMYGFTFAEKAFDRLKTDGTFTYEAYPKSGNEYEYYAAKLEFSVSECKTEKLFGTYVDSSDVYHYYNGNKEITKDDAEALWDIQNAKESPEWSPLGRWYLKPDNTP